MEFTLEQALQKGIEAHKAGRAEEADRYYTAILKAQPNHPDANHNMGVLAVGIGRVQEGLPFFKAALEANPSIAQFWLSYIDALIKLERIEDAKGALKLAKSKGAKGDSFDQLENKLFSRSLSSVSGISEIPKSELESLMKLYRQKKLKQVLEAAQSLTKKYSKSPTLWNLMGVSASQLGLIDKAIFAFKNTLLIKPDSVDALNNLGLAYKEQGDLDNAIEAYEKAISLKPTFAEAYNNLGIALKEEGKLDASLEVFAKAVSLNSKFTQAHFNMANTFLERGDYSEAVKANKKAISLNPSYAFAHGNMGIALKEQGKIKQAIQAFKKAISIKPDYADVYWNLSGTASNLADAKRWLEKCLKADPNHSKAIMTIPALEYYEGKTDKYNSLINSAQCDHPYVRSYKWAFSLHKLPEIFFHRWDLFDRMIEMSKKDRPFYEFGVWKGASFTYLIKTFKKGFGFDTFTGIPEDWHETLAGTYSSEHKIPKIDGGQFIVGEFSETLPKFFEGKRPTASIINFDSDLYSSTVCALKHAKSVIDEHTILIFDEFIINQNWEKDEYRALEEFCSENNYTYEVLAISFFTKQVAVRIIGI